MLAGLDKDHKEKLHLKEASHYKYLVGGGITTCEGRDDAEEFAEIRSAMKVLEMTDQEIWDILKVMIIFMITVIISTLNTMMIMILMIMIMI